ncbi:MAG: dTDP-4-dehydrorhamnose 3,5-epimerase [Gemmatimonadaceae bacterium]|nr:dTDP-4-dehydrorhamnose 3,5-epimerase [Gemmatimonadaceae bacterium]
MTLRVEPLVLPEVVRVTPTVHRDARGAFWESWRAEEYAALTADAFVQDNVAISHRGVLRGLHFQHPGAQAKLVSVVRGRIFDVAVDVRRDSPTFGRWVGAELSDENAAQLFIPAGFAHGYLTLSDEAIVAYKCTEYYAPGSEHSLRWDDQEVGIEWPIENPALSPRDAAAAFLKDIDPAELPRR